MKMFFVVAFLGATAVPVALAATNPWDGNWKLDASKSHLAGQTFTYSKQPNGMWRVTAGTVSFDFTVNGQPYKTIDADDTVSVSGDGDHAADFVYQFKGKEVSKTHEVLSSDGKTLTDHTTEYRPDGTTSESTTVSTRVGNGSGWAGTWKSTQVTMSTPDSYTISSPSPDTIKWEIPAYKETVEGKLDNTPLTITGPTVSPGLTLTLKKVAPGKLEYWVKMRDKTLDEGNMTVSADGKWLTDVSWNPEKENEKTTAVYMKQ